MKEARDGGFLPIGAWLILVTAVTGLFLSQEPLRPTSPGDSGASTTPFLEAFPARLWQDPFAPVDEREWEDADLHPLLRTPRQLGMRIAQCCGRESHQAGESSAEHETPLAIFVALVPRSDSPKENELRRRLRYAVVSGLATRGFISTHSGHLGMLRTRWKPDGRWLADEGRLRIVRESSSSLGRTAGSYLPPVDTPFEWFERDALQSAKERHPDRVLLLWLDEDLFGARPLTHTADLVQYLLASAADESKGRSLETLRERTHLVVLGPTNSETLFHMMQEEPREASDPEVQQERADSAKLANAWWDRLRSALLMDLEARQAAARRIGASGAGFDARSRPASPPDLREDLVASLVRSLVRQADEYLDWGLAIDEAQRAALDRELSDAIPESLAEFRADSIGASQRLARVLAAHSGPLQDSDPEWPITVASSWLHQLASEPSSSGEDPEVFLARELAHGLELEANFAFGGFAEEEMQLAAEFEAPILEWLRAGDEAPAPDVQRVTNLLHARFPNTIRDESDLATELLREVLAELSRRILGEPPPSEIELVGTQAFDPLPVLAGATVISYRATAAPDLLLYRGESDAIERTDGLSGSAAIAARLAASAGVDFRSVVASDDRTTRVLVQELERRGIDMQSHSSKDHVVLLGEWDNFYSRSLPLAFEAVVKRSRLEDPHTPFSTTLRHLLKEESLPPERIHRFSYLRGLAGTQRARAEGERAGSSNDARNAMEEEDRGRERPYGDDQLDHIQRLAGLLERFEQVLTGTKGGRIAAIGILGEDVHDKVLLLQALSERFPSAIFFTTDLDELLAHPSQYAWTRNLVVASSFGLDLHPKLQGRIPPFREGYQSAAYLGTLFALGPLPRLEDAKLHIATPGERLELLADLAHASARDGGDDCLHASELDALLEPRIFEVGRHGAYDLTPDAELSALHVKREHPFPRSRVLITAGIAVLLLLLAIFPISSGLSGMFARKQELLVKGMRAERRVLGFALVFFLALFVAIGYSTRGGGGEPLEFTDGISIWPTEFIYICALCSSVHFLLSAKRQLDENSLRLARQYGLYESDPEKLLGFGKALSASWRVGAPALPPYSQGVLRAGLARLRAAYRSIRAAYAVVSINVWMHWIRTLVTEGNEARRGKGAAPGAVDVQALWSRYIQLGLRRNRTVRVLLPTVLYFVFDLAMQRWFGRPHVPYRGELAHVVDVVLTSMCWIAVSFMVFWVVDALRLCRAFVGALSELTLKWPECIANSELVRARGLNEAEFSEFLPVELVARRTRAIGRVMVYPFLVLFLLTVARLRVFDDWSWPISSSIFFTILIALTVYSGVRLRRQAERLRQRSIHRLEEKLTSASDGPIVEADVPEKDARTGKKRRKEKTPDAGGPPGRRRQLERLLHEVVNQRAGAYSALRDNPVVQTVLLPFGGVSIVALVDGLSKLSHST